jgi:hypothetical protein
VRLFQIHPPLALGSPVFGNLFSGFVQPISISGQTDDLDRRKPLGRITDSLTDSLPFQLWYFLPVPIGVAFLPSNI